MMDKATHHKKPKPATKSPPGTKKVTIKGNGAKLIVKSGGKLWTPTKQLVGPKKSTAGQSGRVKPARSVAPISDAKLGPVPGIPDESQITAAVEQLGRADRKAFEKARRLLAEHLGSEAAARLWLVTAGTGFETTALDAVRKGQAKLLLATLESQWGPSPTYA